MNTTDSNSFCEFDVALLTKSGQPTFFECKSGIATPEVLKARNYSSYAVSGVYGMPVLITPFTNKEIKNCLDNGYKNIDGLKYESEEYKLNKSVIETIKAAKRSNMKIWSIESVVVMQQQIKELYHNVLGGAENNE